MGVLATMIYSSKRLLVSSLMWISCRSNTCPCCSCSKGLRLTNCWYLIREGSSKVVSFWLLIVFFLYALFLQAFSVFLLLISYLYQCLSWLLPLRSSVATFRFGNLFFLKLLFFVSIFLLSASSSALLLVNGSLWSPAGDPLRSLSLTLHNTVFSFIV